MSVDMKDYLAYQEGYEAGKRDAAAAIEALNRLVDLNTERCEGLREQLRKAQEQYEKHLNELEKELSFSESTYEEFQIVAATQNALLANQLPKRDDGCDVCRNGNLEEGDTLYKSSDWDGGIGFDYIRDIRFCPICGRKLKVQDDKA